MKTRRNPAADGCQWCFADLWCHDAQLPKRGVSREHFVSEYVQESALQDYLWQESAAGSELYLSVSDRVGQVLSLDKDAGAKAAWHRFAMLCADQIMPLWDRFQPQDRILRKALEEKRKWLDGKASDTAVENAARRVLKARDAFQLNIWWRIAELVVACCKLDDSAVARVGGLAKDLPLAFPCPPKLWMERTLTNLLIEVLERKQRKQSLGNWQKTGLACLRKHRTAVEKAVAQKGPVRLWCAVDAQSAGGESPYLLSTARAGGEQLCFAAEGVVGEVLDWKDLIGEFRLRAVEPLLVHWQAQFAGKPQVSRAVEAYRNWLEGRTSEKELTTAAKAAERAWESAAQKRAKTVGPVDDSPEWGAALAAGFAAASLGPPHDSFSFLNHMLLAEAHRDLEDATTERPPTQRDGNQDAADALSIDSNEWYRPHQYSRFEREHATWIASAVLSSLEKLSKPTRIQKAAIAKLREELQELNSGTQAME
jgi:hypothetical protein